MGQHDSISDEIRQAMTEEALAESGESEGDVETLMGMAFSLAASSGLDLAGFRHAVQDVIAAQEQLRAATRHAPQGADRSPQSPMDKLCNLAVSNGWDADGFRHAANAMRELSAAVGNTGDQSIRFLHEQIAKAREAGNPPALSLLLEKLDDLVKHAPSGGNGGKPSAPPVPLAPFLMSQVTGAIERGDTGVVAVLLGNLRELAETEPGGVCSLEALLHLSAGEDGFSLVYGAEALLDNQRWSLWSSHDDLQDVVGGYDYEVTSLYEHFASEVRVAIMRALLVCEGALGLDDLAQAAGCKDPLDCAPHLDALMDAGLIAQEGKQYGMPSEARGVVALALSIARDRARHAVPEEEA